MSGTETAGEVSRMVGRRIRSIRQERGLTAGQLIAEHAVQMDANALYRIETGGRSVTVDDLLPLAHALGVTPAELLAPPSTREVPW